MTGKIKPLKLLQDNVDFQNGFSVLGPEEVVDCAIQDPAGHGWMGMRKIIQDVIESFRLD